jgi:hypothetical protein
VDFTLSEKHGRTIHLYDDAWILLDPEVVGMAGVLLGAGVAAYLLGKRRHDPAPPPPSTL